MKFITLTEEEYTKYIKNNPQGGFMQTVQIANLRKKSKWNINYVGVIENKNVIAGSLLLSKSFNKKMTEFYTPRGPVMDYNNIELVKFFFNELKEYIKLKNGYVLRIDPYIISNERDINGKLVDNGINNKLVIEVLKSIGFIKKDKAEQVDWTFVLPLTNIDENTIMKNMRIFTSRNIKKAIKNGVTIKELKRDELNQFVDIMNLTSERKHFVGKPLSYYEDMYDLFNSNKEIKYLMANIDLNQYINSLKKELEDLTKRYDNLVDNDKNKGKRNDLQNQISSINKKISESISYLEKEGTPIINLSCAMFILVGEEVLFLFGGNNQTYMSFGGQYLIQWDMIKYAVEHGFKRFNFYGISGNFNPKDVDYGIYDFKRGFGGVVEELIGEYELPITSDYNSIRRKEKFKKTFKKLLGK